MKYRFCTVALMFAAVSISTAQKIPLASSHGSATSPARKAAAKSAVATPTTPAIAKPVAVAKPAVRVNGAVLTDVDVVREMYAIFPYAQQHNGFPKDLEADIRKGATEMVVFEELVYQEAKRRNLAVPAERLAKAEATFRKQFPDKETFESYLTSECGGSQEKMREKIRRSLLIEQMFKTEIDSKSVVTDAALKAYYDANGKQFEHGETVSIQTISLIPPENASQAIKDEAKLKIKDIARLGKAAKTPRDFGMIAEQLSEDDWRTRLGDRGTMNLTDLPTQVSAVARKMKAGEVSDPIAVERAWVVIRVNAHTPAGKTPFVEVKKKLKADLMKQKKSQLRSALNQKLHKDAKIEVL